MKKALILLVVILLFFSSAFSQDTLNFGKNNEHYLFPSEANYFDSLFANQKGSFEFRNQKIGFVDGQVKVELISKSEFFTYYIFPYLSNKIKPFIFFTQLNQEEQTKAGGYSGIITFFKSSLSEKDKKKILQQLKEKVN